MSGRVKVGRTNLNSSTTVKSPNLRKVVDNSKSGILNTFLKTVVV